MPDHETGYFTEANSADVVVGRNRNAKDKRLEEIMEIVTRHLHAAVREIEPTPEEWFQAIGFLTATGHKCDDWRQEFILLSDVLGVSMLVDAINSRRPTGSTENTVLGPFHVEGAPEYEMGANISQDLEGESLWVHGKVTDIAGNPLHGVKLDVWQANDNGFYDVQQKGVQPDFNLRGVFHTGSNGEYSFRAVKPRSYSIPDDGPVGDMLGNLGRPAIRPAHLHFILSRPGYDTLTTHIFDAKDPHIDSDAVFGVKQSLLAEFHREEDLDKARAIGFDRAYWEVEFDFVLSTEAECK